MELKEEIRSIIAGVLEMPAEELAYDAEMEYVEGWDSMHNVMILSALEDHYEMGIVGKTAIVCASWFHAVYELIDG